MPSVIPTSAISFAIDDVLIRASSVGDARGAENVLAWAQARASRHMQEATDAATALRRQAYEQGYLDGMREAVAVVMASVSDTAAVAASLADRAMASAAARIRQSMQESGVEAELITRYCQIVQTVDTVPAVLRVPRDGAAMAEAIAARLASLGVQVRLDDVESPLLDVGHVAYEFVSAEAVISHAMASLSLSDTHVACLDRLASCYATRVADQLSQTTARMNRRGASK